MQLNYEPLKTSAGNSIEIGTGSQKPGSRPPITITFGIGNHPTIIHTCSKKCTSVTSGCLWGSIRYCTCYAQPVSLYFWHSGDCGPVHTLSPKRDLAQQRGSFYLNATAQYASPNNAITLSGPSLAAQLASGMLPFPCNASYVSFACGDSVDGIVHEPPQNWLGAMLPENAKELPPVPEEFLKIHGIGEGNVQVTLEK